MNSERNEISNRNEKLIKVSIDAFEYSKYFTENMWPEVMKINIMYFQMRSYYNKKNESQRPLQKTQTMGMAVSINKNVAVGLNSNDNPDIAIYLQLRHHRNRVFVYRLEVAVDFFCVSHGAPWS